MIKAAIDRVVRGEHLSEEEAVNLMEDVMSGKATDAQIAAFITAMRIKGETVDEITGFARVMRQKATRVETRHPKVLDTCGTGGDGSHTFNISHFIPAGFYLLSAEFEIIQIAFHKVHILNGFCKRSYIKESYISFSHCQ